MKTLFPAHAQQGQKYATGGNNLSPAGLPGSRNHAPLRFFTDNTERARFSAAGYSGTGTSNPHESLHVSGNIRTDGTRSIINGFNGGNNHWMATAGQEPHSVFMAFNGTADGQAQAVSIAPGGNTGAGLTVTASKNVGIGTAYPDEKLQVNGNVKITQDVHIAGKMGIGTGSVPQGYNLAVCGKIKSKEVEVDISNWCDYVFENHYNLVPLLSLEKEIKKMRHLPGIPDENEVIANGLALGEMNKLLLTKIEELTLYCIELQKQINNLVSQFQKK